MHNPVPMKLPIGAAVKGGTSLKNKTGAWRSFRPIVHAHLCIQCDLCRMFCPDACVFVDGEDYQIDYGFCKGCGICANECPKDAIEMVAEEK